jgi:hypothetical protein
VVVVVHVTFVFFFGGGVKDVSQDSCFIVNEQNGMYSCYISSIVSVNENLI